jgi:hypothetical protein
MKPAEKLSAPPPVRVFTGRAALLTRRAADYDRFNAKPP